jgi:hypothetical protein
VEEYVRFSLRGNVNEVPEWPVCVLAIHDVHVHTTI